MWKVVEAEELWDAIIISVERVLVKEAAGLNRSY